MKLSALLICGVMSWLVMPALTWAQDAGDASAEAEKHALAMEKWAQENEAKIEAWAKKFEGQWEDWAKKFETQWEGFAADQEKAWEGWAEKYAQRWEEWGKAMQSQEFDSAEMAELFNKNLQMLGDMPLGEMIEKAMKQSGEGLRDAPWESLGDLQGMIQDSLKQSMEQLENLEIDDEDDRSAASSAIRNFQKAIDQVQAGLEVKNEKIKEQTSAQMEKLKAQLDRVRGDSGQSAVSDSVREQIDRARSMALRQLERADRARADADDAREGQQRAERLRELAGQNNSSKTEATLLRELYKELADDRDEIESKNDTLEALRKEIQALREEIKRLKEDK